MSEAATILRDLADSGPEGPAVLAGVRNSITKYLRANKRKPDSAEALWQLVGDLIGRDATDGICGRLPQALLSGVQRREDLLRDHGGVESSDTTARRLGMSKQAILDRSKHGALLGLRTLKQNAVVFPVFQFSADGAALLPGLGEVLEALNQQTALDGWAKCNFLLSPRASLGGKTPLALLRDGHTRRVVNLARAYAQG